MHHVPQAFATRHFRGLVGNGMPARIDKADHAVGVSAEDQRLYAFEQNRKLLLAPGDFVLGFIAFALGGGTGTGAAPGDQGHEPDQDRGHGHEQQRPAQRCQPLLPGGPVGLLDDGQQRLGAGGAPGAQVA